MSRYKKLYLFPVFQFVFALYLPANNPDSINNSIKSLIGNKTIKEQVKLLDSVVNAIRPNDPGTALFYASKEVELARLQNDLHLLGNAFNVLAKVQKQLSEFNMAIASSDQALAVYRQSRDTG